MSSQTHYEVQVQQGGRWSIHARYDGWEKDTAIEEARSLDKMSGIGFVKVIKEVFDPDEGTYLEFIVYKSPDLKAETGGAGTPRSAATSSTGQDEDTGANKDGFYEDDVDDDVEEDGFGGVKKKKKPPPPKQPKSLLTIIIKVALVTLFSIAIAFIFTYIATQVFSGEKVFGVRITGTRESNMVFLVFVSTFLISAITMAMTFLKGDTLKTNNAGKYQRPPARARQRRASGKTQPQKPQKIQPQPGAGDVDSLGRAMAGIENYKLEDVEEDSAPPANADNEDTGKDDIPGAQTFGTTEPDAPALSPHAEKQKALMMTFLGDALKGVKQEQAKMDNFNKFGVNLFLAGACETLTQKRELDGQSKSRILADSVRVMGFKKSHASSFADKYEEYLMADARYMQMFQAGRNALSTFLSDPDAAPKHLESALEEWNKPKQKEEQVGPITVLFTDIAGSTAMTQALGDAGAQEVVRAHNRVVRAALTDHRGKEVKHTGDGIMASFSSTSDGLDAAIHMQRGTELHNKQNPKLPLHLKIGINTGEPIQEDNDLFGATVQMSARIVDKAQADEIFVSEIVRGICSGKGYKFKNRGGFPMKGFDGDVPLFEVEWRE